MSHCARVICEMLHTALLREKQVEVLARFKAQHEARFGRRVPRIIPEASLLGVQLIHQPHAFHGYHAPVPLFFEPGSGAGSRNAVGVFPAEKRTADWYMPNMSLPLSEPIPVNAGDCLQIRFQYDAGGSIESLQSSLQASLGPDR